MMARRWLAILNGARPDGGTLYPPMAHRGDTLMTADGDVPADAETDGGDAASE